VAVSEIDYFATGCAQLPGEKPFQFEAAVVRGNADDYRRTL
jgi:hypothetical protein